mmetsp:Transcript_1140/g.4006  ORF Transcript_1140/g.4006 Transcript_1140/m.4006 type:complete len:205 (+) Transcript_1140:793-1407(+)
MESVARADTTRCEEPLSMATATEICLASRRKQVESSLSLDAEQSLDRPGRKTLSSFDISPRSAPYDARPLARLSRSKESFNIGFGPATRATLALAALEARHADSRAQHSTAEQASKPTWGEENSPAPVSCQRKEPTLVGPRSRAAERKDSRRSPKSVAVASAPRIATAASTSVGKDQDALSDLAERRPSISALRCFRKARTSSP